MRGVLITCVKVRHMRSVRRRRVVGYICEDEVDVVSVGASYPWEDEVDLVNEGGDNYLC